MRFSAFFLFLPLMVQAQAKLSTGLYQLVREDGQASLMEVGAMIKKALLYEEGTVKVLNIVPKKKDGSKYYSFCDKEGTELFSSVDSPKIKMPRLRYSFAPVPVEGIMTHKGFIVSGRAFRSLKGESPKAVNLDTLKPSYALLAVYNNFWMESYYDLKLVKEASIDPSPLSGFLGQIVYRALSMDGRHWAVHSSVNYGGTGSFSEIAVFKKDEALLTRLALLASGDRGFGGVQNMRLENSWLVYERHLNEVPARWAGLYSEGLSLALSFAGAGSSLIGSYRFKLGDEAAELVKIKLTRDMKQAEGGKILAKKGSLYTSPAAFQKLLKSLIPEIKGRQTQSLE